MVKREIAIELKIVILTISVLSAGLARRVYAAELKPPFIAPMTSSSTLGSATANGIYVIDGVHRNSIDKAVLNSSVIDGIVLSIPWNVIEPQEGNYFWTSIDNILAQAAAYGKKVSLVLGSGWQTPSWVYADGAGQLKFIWDHDSWGPPLCSVVSIPLPWDSIYLAKWKDLIDVAGARYDSDPRIASIKVSGITSKTQETFLPSSVNQKISSRGTSCTSYDDVADWQAAGYTRLKVEAAWQDVMQMFAQAFPDKKLEPMLIPGGFPAIDDNGNRFTAPNNQDQEVSNDLLNYGVAEYPAVFTIQNDGWTARWIWEAEAAYATRVSTGYQEVSALKTQTAAAITKALNSGATYLEFYESDAILASQQSALANAHQELQ